MNFSSNMHSGMKSPGAAAASCNMNDDDDHASAIIPHAVLFIHPLSLRLQLATAAPGLFMPLSFMLLKIMLVRKLISNSTNNSKSYDLQEKVRLNQLAGMLSDMVEQRRRKWAWAGHVGRMLKWSPDRWTVQVLGWQPKGKRLVGRPKKVGKARL